MKLSNTIINQFINAALDEDIGSGDLTTLAIVPNNIKGTGTCQVKSDGIIAGIEIAEKIFRKLDQDCLFKPLVNDGEQVQKGNSIFIIRGNARALLQAERLVLNILQRLSGIATTTYQITSLIKDTECKILDTRKTTPLFRHFEKWAVTKGGGFNHRIGLFDMILIKDNHIAIAGGVKNAIRHVNTYKQNNNIDVPVICEASSIEEIEDILQETGVDRILLDNMPVLIIKEALHIINQKVETEASGNINISNVLDYAKTGVNFISMGYLTHSYSSLDISLKIHYAE